MNNQKETGFLLLMVLAMFLWGASWVSGKLVTGEAVAIDLVIFWRMLICCLGFLAFYPVRRFKLILPARQTALIIINGLLMVLYNHLFFIGLSRGLAGKAGVIVTGLNPVFTFIIASLLFRYAIRRVQIVGVVLGFIGGVLLLEPWAYSLKELSDSSLILIVAGLNWSVITLISGRIMQSGVGNFSYNFYFYLAAFIASLGLAWNDNPFDFQQYSGGVWINILFLAVFATIGATSIYFFATQRIGFRQGNQVLLCWYRHSQYC